MGKIFKKSLMGFSKEQVIAYIDNLVDKQKAALEEEKEKYIQLQEENEKLVNERDNALELAREELQSEIDAMKSEKDELMLQLEELKNENASLTASNEKLMKDKNELFESIKSIKSQLNEYMVKEKAEKEKLEELEEAPLEYYGNGTEPVREDTTLNSFKKIFTSKEIASDLLKKNIVLSSANSMNFGRLAPQITYYFHKFISLHSSIEEIINRNRRVYFLNFKH